MLSHIPYTLISDTNLSLFLSPSFSLKNKNEDKNENKSLLKSFLVYIETGDIPSCHILQRKLATLLAIYRLPYYIYWPESVREMVRGMIERERESVDMICSFVQVTLRMNKGVK
mmetsp:Transcript_6375/g.6592  ORF Transcript_6375/g.6592 Transcript_6375/m.6592 type:complete len:114 (+) Transcript_6375:241-582(+)